MLIVRFTALGDGEGKRLRVLIKKGKGVSNLGMGEIEIPKMEDSQRGRTNCK